MDTRVGGEAFEFCWSDFRTHHVVNTDSNEDEGQNLRQNGERYACKEQIKLKKNNVEGGGVGCPGRDFGARHYGQV